MTPLEFLYFMGLSAKKRYLLGHQERLPRKVISIGNLTLGGTGKTPAAIALAAKAVSRGLKPCILTRGYKGRAKDPCVVSSGEAALLDVCMAGDEAVLMSEKLRGVPIVKGRNRYEAGVAALNELPSELTPDLFILDDGFQHWRLWRDRDILLIDGARPFGNGRILPLGTLREPVSAIDRADIIVITKQGELSGNGGLQNGKLIRQIARNNSKAPVYFAEHRPSNFVTVKGEIFPLEWANGKKFFGFCGIGSPWSFRETLISAGFELTGFRTFSDHYQYKNKDLKSITAEAETTAAGWIVTTEKDIMRLKGLKLPEKLVALAVEFLADEEFYNEAFKDM